MLEKLKSECNKALKSHPQYKRKIHGIWELACDGESAENEEELALGSLADLLESGGREVIAQKDSVRTDKPLYLQADKKITDVKWGSLKTARVFTDQESANDRADFYTYSGNDESTRGVWCKLSSDGKVAT